MLSLEERRKRQLRREALRRRNHLTPQQIEAKSRLIAQRLLSMDIWRQAAAILGYCAFNSEVRTEYILRQALSQGKRVALPRICREKRELDLYYVGGLDDEWLEPGTWRIPEPSPARCAPASISDIDLVLVPGVAFDTTGGRIGYGGGYYDRLLNRLDSRQQERVVGLAFEEQIVRDVPLNFFDFRVPLILTDARVIVTGFAGAAINNTSTRAARE